MGLRVDGVSLKGGRGRGVVGAVQGEKAHLRAAMRAALAALPPARRALEGELVQAAVQQESVWRAADTVLLYYAQPPEFSVVGLTLAAWRDGKRTLFPRVAGPRMLALGEARSWSDLRPGAFGLREPVATAQADSREVDLAIVPGLAFDAAGGRLGRGGAYYDDLLPSLSRSWGVGFNCQLVDRVPCEDHDAPVSGVWTCRTRRLLDS